jgi:transcriptional antiterminator NusG
MFFVIRVTMGQERILIRMLWKKAKKEQLPIYAIISPDGVKGYMFVEAEDENAVSRLIRGVKSVKGMLSKSIPLEDVKRVLERSAKSEDAITVGDVVEMTSGPFKGERAKVISKDEAKDELTVELLDVAVPVPVSVKKKMVKLIARGEDYEG